MVNRDTIEFYEENNLVAWVASSMIPMVGDKISIRKKTWQVAGVSFSLDHAEEYVETAMRCNVQLVAPNTR